MKQHESLTPQTYSVLSHSELPMAESAGEVWSRMFNRAFEEARANAPKAGETVIIQMVDGPKQDMISKTRCSWAAIAFRALAKQVADLSDMEKFCIAVCAGIEIESYKIERKPGEPVPVPTLNWRTKKPVRIVKDRDGFKVFVKE